MHQPCIYQSMFFHVCTHMYASIMHIATAVISSVHIHVCINYASIMHLSNTLPSMHIHVCIDYAYINRSAFNHAHTCMNQVCIIYASANRRSCNYAHTCMHQLCIYQSRAMYAMRVLIQHGFYLSNAAHTNTYRTNPDVTAVMGSC